MYANNTLRILSSQSSGRCHSIAAMSRNHFLIGFEAPNLGVEK